MLVCVKVFINNLKFMSERVMSMLTISLPTDAHKQNRNEG